MKLTQVEQLQRIGREVESGQRCANCLRWIGEKRGPPIRGCYECAKEDAEAFGLSAPGRA